MNNERARAALELDLARHRDHPTSRPRSGWVRAIRDAVGMSTRDLAVRMDVSAPRISQIERGEVRGSVTLATLERVAAALGCQLEYVLVPVEPLDEMVIAQGRRKASRLVEGVEQTMALENQSTGPEVGDRQLDDLARSYVDMRGLWSDQ